MDYYLISNAYLLIGMATLLVIAARNMHIMNPFIYLAMASIITFILYVYALIAVFYILYQEEVSDIYIDVDPKYEKLNLYNSTYKITKAIQNAGFQYM